MPDVIVMHQLAPMHLTADERATISRQLALSGLAEDVAAELLEAYELNGPAGFTARRVLRGIAERAVMLTQPSRRENALGAAHRAQRETILTMLETVARQPKYADHSSADLVRRALTDFAAMLDRVGPNYLLAAYEGSLEAPR